MGGSGLPLMFEVDARRGSVPGLPPPGMSGLRLLIPGESGVVPLTLLSEPAEVEVVMPLLGGATGAGPPDPASPLGGRGGRSGCSADRALNRKKNLILIGVR